MDTQEPNIAESYLFDLGQLIKEAAREAKSEFDSTVRPGDKEYAVGRLMAYHEVVSVMQQQAVAFGLGLDRLNLADIEPERDLL